MLIRSVGLFWQEEAVFWGAGSKAGSLLGVPSNNTTAKPIDFRKQIGIYALYADYDLVACRSEFVTADASGGV
jgi:hypothetical protein